MSKPHIVKVDGGKWHCAVGAVRKPGGGVSIPRQEPYGTSWYDPWQAFVKWWRANNPQLAHTFDQGRTQ